VLFLIHEKSNNFSFNQIYKEIINIYGA